MIPGETVKFKLLSPSPRMGFTGCDLTAMIQSSPFEKCRLLAPFIKERKSFARGQLRKPGIIRYVVTRGSILRFPTNEYH